VSQWGGKVVDKIGVDTDFVVLGAEPVIPNFSTEELADPVNIKKQEDAKAELAQYEQVLKEAKELHIPILNQNRFLYFTGQEEAVLR
jgi:imidazolonepropionase-like amidohydrolase